MPLENHDFFRQDQIGRDWAAQGGKTLIKVNHMGSMREPSKRRQKPLMNYTVAGGGETLLKKYYFSLYYGAYLYR